MTFPLTAVRFSQEHRGLSQRPGQDLQLSP